MSLRVSPAEAEAFKRAARINRQAAGDFLRQAGLAAAADCGVELPPRHGTGVRVFTPSGVT